MWESSVDSAFRNFFRAGILKNRSRTVTLEREQSIVAHHAPAVVGDLNEFFPAGLYLNPNAGGTGVEGIFEEFLGYRSWAFHHLASGDFVGDMFGEDVDSAHDKSAALAGS